MSPIDHHDDAPTREELLPAGLDVPEQLGPFRLLRRLGSGAAGAVYLAELHEPTRWGEKGQITALKLLHADRMERLTSFHRFVREGELGQVILHPAVVRTYASGHVQAAGRDWHFLALEFVEGETLSSLMGGRRAVPEALLRQVGAQVAHGLAALHAAGVVHRDIKPSNIILTPEHLVKILDLGLARPLDAPERLTQLDHFVGTPRYAAPEQCMGAREIGPPADLYSLGVLLYEAATGRSPFAGDGVSATLRAHLELIPTPPSRLNPRLSPLLERVILGLLVKDPADRLGPAQRVAQTLEEGEDSAWWRENGASLTARDRRHAARLCIGQDDTPFVGRARELAILRELYQDVRGGKGRVALIEGEQGLGKTCLVDQFLCGFSSDAQAPIVLAGAYRSGPGGGLAAIPGAITSFFGPGGCEPGLRQYLADQPRLREELLEYLGSGTGQGSGESLHAGVCALARSLAAEAPVVWIVENLHQASVEGRALFLSLARLAAEERVLVIATTQPGLPAQDLASLELLRNLRRIHLERLSAREIVTLLQAVLRSEELALRLGGRVGFRSDGNPFFVLEMVRMLRDSGAIHQGPDGSYSATEDISVIDVPSSIRELVLARLHELSEEERRLLDLAAVQGFEFDASLLADVREQKRLHVLETLAAIERRCGIVRARGAGFHFDHHQLRDLLYQALPAALRAEYHALLAESYEQRPQVRGRSPEQLSLDAALFLAEHKLKGGDGAAGAIHVVRALDCLGANCQDEMLVDLAQMALGTLGVEQERLACEVRLRLARALDGLGRRAEQSAVLERAVAAAEQGGWTDLLARAYLELGWLLHSTGSYAAAGARLELALTSARSIGDGVLQARALSYLGSVACECGERAVARARFEESRELARQLGHQVGEINAIGNLGILDLNEGQYAQAERRFLEQLALCRASTDRRGQVRALGNLAIAQRVLGRFDLALSSLREQVDLACDIGYRRAEAVGAGNLGGLHFAMGDLGRAGLQFRRHLLLSRAIGDRLGEATALLNGGVVAVEEGRLDAARAPLEQALELAGAIGSRYLGGEALVALGDLEIAAGRPERASEYYELALAERRVLGNREAEALTLVALGRAAWDRGDPERAVELWNCAEEIDSPTSAPGVLAAAWLVHAGKRAAGSVQGVEGLPTPQRALVHVLLGRAGGDPEHLARARDCLARMSEHLVSREDRERFRQFSPLARLNPI